MHMAAQPYQSVIPRAARGGTIGFGSQREGARPRMGADEIGNRRALRNSLFNLVTQGGYATCNVLVVFLLVRGLSQSAFGAYYAAFSLILAVQLVIEAGFGTVLTCRIAQAPEQEGEIVQEASGLFAIITVLSMAMFLVLGAFHLVPGGEPSVTTCAAACACGALQVQRYCTGILRGREMYGRENLARLTQGGLFAGSVFGLVIRERAGLGSVLMLMAASHVIAAGILVGGLPPACAASPGG